MKKPVVLLIVLGALVAFALIYQKTRDNRLNSARLVGVKDREYLFPEFPVDAVRQVTIREGSNTTTLAVEEGRWVVKERDGFTGAFEKIARAVSTIADLKLQGKTVVGKSALGDVALLPPGEGTAEMTGLQVEMKNEKGEVLGSFIAGKTVESAGGASSNNFMGGGGQQRWVRTPKDEDTIWLTSESLYDLQADPKEWLDKAFIDVKDIKSVEVTLADAAESWTAVRKDLENPFAFAGGNAGGELDTAKADFLNRAFSGTVLNDVVTKEKAGADFMKGAAKVKIVTFQGFTYVIDLVEKKEGESEAKYYVTFAVSADLPKERKAAADEKPEDKTKNDEAFVAERKAQEAKLAREKALEGRIYEVSAYGVSDLLKKKSELLREAAPAEGAAEGAPPTLSPSSPPPAIPQVPPTPPQVQIPMAPAPSPENPTELKPSPEAAPKPEPAPAPAPSPEKPAETKPSPDAKPEAPKTEPAKPEAETAPKPEPAPAAAPAPAANPAPPEAPEEPKPAAAPEAGAPTPAQ